VSGKRTSGDDVAEQPADKPALHNPMPESLGDFTPPPWPPPRERYIARVEPLDEGSKWSYKRITVLRLDGSGEPIAVVATYERNYGGFFETFEPFRQNGRDYALISSRYVAIDLLDLQTGEIAKGKPVDDQFCPVGFYVPDWCDVNGDPAQEVTGDQDWSGFRDYWWPRSDFGFAAGRAWSDSASARLRYLDLSRASEGIVRWDERFGHIELPDGVPLRQAVQITDYDNRTVQIAIRATFDLVTGDMHGPGLRLA
jgi:hypothetical protein